METPPPRGLCMRSKKLLLRDLLLSCKSSPITTNRKADYQHSNQPFYLSLFQSDLKRDVLCN